jgi:hypothetical protein
LTDVEDEPDDVSQPDNVIVIVNAVDAPSNERRLNETIRRCVGGWLTQVVVLETLNAFEVLVFW